MKKTWLFVLLSAVLVLSLAIPFNDLGLANSTPFKLTVVNPELAGKSDQVRQDLEKARGLKVREDFKLNIVAELNENDIDNSSAIAYDIKQIKGNKSALMKEQAQQLLNDKKVVYIYGGLTETEANEIFGQELFTVFSEEELKEELIEKGLPNEDIDTHLNAYKEEVKIKYDVIGAYKLDGKTTPFIAQVDSDSSVGLTHYVDSILDHVNSDLFPRNSLFSLNTVKADRVNSVLDRNVTAYSGTTKVAHINMDYYLEKEPDSDSTYDYFALKDHMEFTAYNGASPWLMNIHHDIPYAADGTSDEIEDWNPYDSTNDSSFSVSLPWGISWSFTTNDDVDVDTTGSQSNDYVMWDISEARTFSSYLHNPERFTPGHAWLSTGTLAVTAIKNTAYYDYKGETRSLSYNYTYRYDY